MSYEYVRGMGFIDPCPITTANLTTNVAVSTLAPYVPATSYALNVEVLDGITIYRSMADGNLGHPLTDTNYWQPRGVENRMRMFDASLGSVTENAEEIVITIAPGRVVTDMMFFGVEAFDIEVEMNDPVDGQLFVPRKFSMLMPSGNSHWGYFFNPVQQRRLRLHVPDLPAYARATTTIRIRNPGGIAKCAEFVIGRAIWLGNTQWRPSIGWDDWSGKTRDRWGGWQVTPGDYSDRMKLQVLVEGPDFEGVRDKLIPFRAKPVVWLGGLGYSTSLSAYGYVTVFDQVLVSDGISDCNFTIEALT